MPPPVDVYLEQGARRAFACAVAWPGWARADRDREAAVDALVAAGPRYAKALRRSRLGFEAPTSRDGLRIVEELAGDATTDFGAPGRIPAADRTPLDGADVGRLASVLRACWRAFDAVVAGAEGHELRTGPRGGGRRLEAIVDHVVEADRAYLASMAIRAPREAGIGENRRAVEDVLAGAAAGTLPSTRPRRGPVWPPRYFVRRAAWHVLDHTWEIEDRLV